MPISFDDATSHYKARTSTNLKNWTNFIDQCLRNEYDGSGVCDSKLPLELGFPSPEERRFLLHLYREVGWDDLAFYPAFMDEASYFRISKYPSK